MDKDRAQAEAGWGHPGMTDARAMIEATRDAAFLAAMAAQGAPGMGSQPGSMSQTSVPQSFSSTAGMPGGMGALGGIGFPGGNLPFMYPSPDNAAVDLKHASFAEQSSPSDAQLNLKRRISQLVQMRAMQQQMMFGSGGGPGHGMGAAELQPSLFRAQSLPQLQRGDNQGGSMSPGDLKEDIGLWKSQSQKDLQYGPSSPRGSMMMPASPSPRPLSRPLSRPPSAPEGQDSLQNPQGFVMKQEVQHTHTQQQLFHLQQGQHLQQTNHQQPVQQRHGQLPVHQQQQQQQQPQQQLPARQQQQLPTHQQKNHQLAQQQFQHVPKQQQSHGNLNNPQTIQHQQQQPTVSQYHTQQLNGQHVMNENQQQSQQQQHQIGHHQSQHLNMHQEKQQTSQQLGHPKFQHSPEHHQNQNNRNTPHFDMSQQLKGQQFQHQMQGKNHFDHLVMPNGQRGQNQGSSHPQEKTHPQIGHQHPQHQHMQQVHQHSQQHTQYPHQQHTQHNNEQPQQDRLQPQLQQHQQQKQQKQQSDLFRKPTSEMAPSWNMTQGNQETKVNSNKSSFPSIGSYVTTASATSPVMSPVNNVPQSSSLMFDAVSTQSTKPTAQTPSSQYSGMHKNLQSGSLDQAFQDFKGGNQCPPNSFGFSDNANSDVKMSALDGKKQMNGEKPKKVRKPKPKVEKPNSKISDLMASDIDRKLLAMFPQYQFYLDQNTKPDEDLMPAPGIKKPKKKRPANLTPEGEPIKKKKVKKKVEGVPPNIIPSTHSGVPQSPLLASEAAPMDTELSRQQLEDRTVAQILAAIKEPKTESTITGNPEMNPTHVTSANTSAVNIVSTESKSADGQKSVEKDPFDFFDDDISGVVKPLYTKNATIQESKLPHGSDTDKIHNHEQHQKGGSAESHDDKYCCNHCEVMGEVQSRYCQNKLPQELLDSVNDKNSASTSPAGSQHEQQLQSGISIQGLTSATSTSTYHSSTSLSSSNVQCSSAESILATAGKDSSSPPAKSDFKSVSVTSADSGTKPKNYIVDQGPQNQVNPLANLQASVQSMFNSSLSQSNIGNNVPRIQIPQEMLDEYLDRAEGNKNVKSQFSDLPNGMMSSKMAEFLSTNYCPPHDIKPVPPSVPSALNHSEGKPEVKPPGFSPGIVNGPEETTTPQTTPTQDKSKAHMNLDEEDLISDVLKPGSVEEELFERLKNNKVEVPHCDCLGPNSIANESIEGPYYTQLGAGPDVPSIRKVMEDRTGVTGKALRIEKIVYSGKEGKSTQGCPVAKWIIRRSGPEEKYLCVCRYRPGHFCAQAYIVTNLVAWEGVPAGMADDLYTYLRSTITKHGFETERRCGTNERKTCACQGIDLVRRGASFSFGCSWSMYFNGCKYARSRDAKKFKLKDTSKEGELEEKLQNLATTVGPLYQTMAPDAHRNQCNFEVEGGECRLGQNKERPFSGVTACVDFCAHSHKDFHNMNNGSTVVVTLTKHRGFEKPDDEQLHVLPLYILDGTDEHGSAEGQREKIKNGSLEVLANFPLEARMRAQPLTPKKRVKGGKKESPTAKKKKEQEAIINNLPKAGSSPEKEQKAVLEHLMKQENNESLSFEDLMSHSYLPGFNELYGKFWDYFYANGTFPPGSFLSRWAANKMSLMKNQTAQSAGSQVKQNDKMHHPISQINSHPPSQNQPLPHQGEGQQNGAQPMTPQGQGIKPEFHNPLNNHHPKSASQELNGAAASMFSSPLDMLSAAAMMQNGVSANGPGAHTTPISSSQPVPFQPGPGSTPTSGPPPGPHSGLQSGPNLYETAQGKQHPSEHQAMQHQASSLPTQQNKHSSADGHSFVNHPQGFNNRATCDPTGNFMCNGVSEKVESGEKLSVEPDECLMDPTVVKCEWQYNEELFTDPTIGGVAIALGHGAVLFEVAKRELHATTALKNPNRYQPTRISLVFYQHKNLNYRHHGWYENERKMETLRQKKLEKMKAEAENSTPVNHVNGEVKTLKKKKKKEVVDFSKTSAAQYKYMWEAPIRHGISLTTDSIITRWIDPQPMVSGPYQRWV